MSSKRKLAIVISDTHIRPLNRIWKLQEFPAGDVFFALEQVYCKCLEYNPELLLIAGDVFDSKKVTSDCIKTFQILDKPELRHIKKLYVQGQHDLSDPPIISTICGDTFEHLHKKFYISKNGIKFYGLDYSYDVLDLPEESIDVFLTHQVWKEFFSSAIFSLYDLSDRDMLLISGDYHLYFEAYFGDLHFLSPGNLAITDIKSTGSGITILFDDLSVVNEPLQTRKIYKFKFDNLDALYEHAKVNPEEKFFDEAKDLPDYMRMPLIECTIPTSLIKEVKKIYPKSFIYFRELGMDKQEESVLNNDEPLDFLSLLSKKFGNTVYQDAWKLFLEMAKKKEENSDIARTLRRAYENQSADA